MFKVLSLLKVTVFLLKSLQYLLYEEMLIFIENVHKFFISKLGETVYGYFKN